MRKKIDKKNKASKQPGRSNPRWLDCTWRRTPCWRDDCPICGQIKRERERHLAHGEDPNDWQTVLEDLAGSFRELAPQTGLLANKHRHEVKTKFKRLKEPPRPNMFGLYNQLREWRDNIYELADEAIDDLEAWPMFEAGQDLLWYANTIIAKVYRQYCNRWYLRDGEEYGVEDYRYTRYVLFESLNIVNRSLVDLSVSGSGSRGKFDLVRLYIGGLKNRILSI